MTYLKRGHSEGPDIAAGGHSRGPHHELGRHKSAGIGDTLALCECRRVRHVFHHLGSDE
jgi:hypothetical protein